MLGVNLVLLSPYLFVLLTRYSFVLRAPRVDLASVLDQSLKLSLGQGVFLSLRFWAARLCTRRSGWPDRLWLSLALGAVTVWWLHGTCSRHRRPEADEIYYFVRVVVGVVAGIGAWNAARRIGGLLTLPAEVRPAALLLVSFPLALLRGGIRRGWTAISSDRSLLCRNR